MKKIITLLFATAFSFSIFSQVIPNAGFETWINNNETSHTFSMPQHWLTDDIFNAAFMGTYAGTSTIKTTVSHTGSYAVLLQTSINGGDTVNGAIFSVDSLSQLLNSLFGNNKALGFPYSLRSANLQGFYKLNLVGGDSAIVALVMTKWNVNTHHRDTLVNQGHFLTGNVSAYTQFTIPLTYLYNVYPDSVFIEAGIGGPNGKKSHVGTAFYLDDLSFSGTVPVGIKEVKADNNYVEIYPNPFTNSTTIRIDGNVNLTNGSLIIYDVVGKVVKTINNINSNNLRLDRGDMQTGIYFYKLINEDAVITNGRFIIE